MGPGVALVAFLQLCGHERGPSPLYHLGAEPLLQPLRQLRVAGKPARLQDRGADGHVGARLFQALVDRSRRMPDFELEVPQHIEQRLDHLFDAGRRLIGHEE